MAPPDTWTLTQRGYDAATARAWEGLFAQGSGYLQLRGSVEMPFADYPQNVEYLRLPANVTAEKFAPTPSKWGTYVPGVFAPHPTLNREMVNLPWPLELAPRVAGESLDLLRSNVSGFERTLNLRNALLSQTLRWRTADGATLTVQTERLVSAARPHVLAQRITLTSDRAVEVELAAGIDADVRTNGHDHLTHVEATTDGDREVGCTVRTEADEQVRMTSRLAGEGIAGCRDEAGPRHARCVATLKLAADRPVTVEKFTVVTTSRDLDDRQVDPGQALAEAEGVGYAGLRAEHEAAWADKWAACDVVIEGDDASQLALRVSLYHLLRCAVDDGRVSIDAKGYAGEAYFGRYFWDSEINLLPFYLYTMPEQASRLVEFRLNTLDGARRNAKLYGYRGARFGWESDDRGDECCAAWQYRDHEVHITADVVYALAHYAAAVGDPTWLATHAAEVVVEAARYWLDRSDQRPGEDRLSLLGVMGPDEYAPISHNNSYTNRQVAFTFELAASIGEAGGATADEREAFADAARRLSIITDGELVLQCEDFRLLVEPSFDRDWPDRSKQAAQQMTQERIYRTQALKQADVIMLMLLWPNDFTDAQRQAAWEYYLPRTTHDSSLSYGVHAIMACRLGLADKAWEMFAASRDLDLDVDGGKPAEGIHIACAGNNWQAVVFGFAGVQTAMAASKLTLNPRLPDRWSRLSFPLVWHGTPLGVTCEPTATTLTNRGHAPIEATVHGHTQTVAPGADRRFEHG